jgi:hypothetical protein
LFEKGDPMKHVNIQDWARIKRIDRAGHVKIIFASQAIRRHKLSQHDIQGLMSGAVLEIAPMLSDYVFRKYTSEDSVKDAAQVMLAANKLALNFIEAAIPNGLEVVQRLREAIKLAEFPKMDHKAIKINSSSFARGRGAR